MICAFKHQRSYAKDSEVMLLWCPDCQCWLSRAESVNVFLRLLRKASGVSTSEEQLQLEKDRQ